MTISAEALALIEEEKQCLEKILISLESQRTLSRRRLRTEEARAQTLNSQIVAARRDLDKQMLASDEAVAHGLSNLKRDEIAVIDALLEQPYFAHIILEEQQGAQVRQIEFFLGKAANTECRIIDWRKAPISKLYYEYKEGEEYSEEIQGRERDGKVILRNKVDIEARELQKVSCRYGNFRRKKDGTWEESNQRAGRSSSSSYGKLPDVLSLITAEQFQTITEGADTAVLIQGVAGSGKTTVALYRLSWLLHEDNSDVKPEECVILLRSPALQAYIRRSLESMQIAHVPVYTYKEWAARTLARALISNTAPAEAVRRPSNPSPPGIQRVLQSISLLKALEEDLESAIAQLHKPQDIREFLLGLLDRPERILQHDETKLLDRELISLTSRYIRANIEHQLVDPAEDALLLRASELLFGGVVQKNGSLGKYRHIIVDEVQDFSAPELATIVGAVQELNQVTLVGDENQAIADDATFPGWDRLRKYWDVGTALSNFVSLSVSHRSTVGIMRLADHVLGSDQRSGGRPGKPPLWFACQNEDLGITEVLGWLTRVQEKYPDVLTVVLCANPKEAAYAHSLLEPTFRSAVRMGEGASFSFEEGIVVTTVSEVKGLEFAHVLIWNPSAEHYPSTPRARNSLYVAMTRAEEHLCLVTWGKPSPLLPSIHSKLVRGIEKEIEIEEDEDEEDEDAPAYDPEG